MAVPLTHRILIVKYMPVTINGVLGIVINTDYIKEGTTLDIKGSVDFTIRNEGTAAVFLFGGAIKILTGDSWSPPKSTALPFHSNIPMSYEDDFQLTRNVANLTASSTSPAN